MTDVEKKSAADKLLEQFLAASKALNENDAGDWKELMKTGSKADLRKRAIGHSEEDDEFYPFTEEFLVCPNILSKGGKVSLENYYKTTAGYLNGTKMELFKANQWKCYLLFMENGPVHKALKTYDNLDSFDPDDHDELYKALQQYKQLLEDTGKYEEDLSAVKEAIEEYDGSEEKKITTSLKSVAQLFVGFALSNWVGQSKDKKNRELLLYVCQKDIAPKRDNYELKWEEIKDRLLWHSHTNPFTREELFKVAPVMSGHIGKEKSGKEEFDVRASASEFLQRKTSSFTSPMKREELMESYGKPLTIRGDIKAHSFNWAYTYLFKFDTAYRDAEPGHPFAFHNMSSDAIDEYFIRPLEVKLRAIASLTYEERDALRTYRKYVQVSFVGSPNRQTPNFANEYLTKFDLDSAKGFYENQEELDTIVNKRNKYRGRKYRVNGMINIFQDELKYDKIREVLLGQTLEERIAYLYYCMHSLTALTKMVYNGNLKKDERKVWNNYISKKLALLMRFLDDKGNWSQKEVKRANRDQKGVELAKVWLDTYASGRFISQMLVKNKASQKEFEFFPTPPDAGVLQAYNENMEGYREQMEMGAKDMDDAISLAQVCSAKGIRVDFYNTASWKMVKNPYKYVNGKPKMNQELRDLYKKGHLHADCVGLLVASAKDLKDSKTTTATVALPDYLKLSQINSMLGSEFPIILQDKEGKMTDFNLRDMVAEIKKTSLKTRDPETGTIISEFFDRVTTGKRPKGKVDDDDDDDDESTSRSESDSAYTFSEDEDEEVTESSDDSEERAHNKEATRFIMKGGDKRAADSMRRSGYLKEGVAKTIAAKNSEFPNFVDRGKSHKRR